MQTMFSAEPLAMITEKVYDLFFVDILSNSFLYKSFDYIICGEDQKMLRRGNFRAPSVQLRTSDLKEGTYQFKLILEGKEYQTCSFEKCNRAE